MFSCLSWLIVHECLEVCIVVFVDVQAPGLYHEKIGVLCDAVGMRVAFQGSANEFVGGFVNNFESILVFLSARPDQFVFVDQLDRDFEVLWSWQFWVFEIIDLFEVVWCVLIEIYMFDCVECFIECIVG